MSKRTRILLIMLFAVLLLFSAWKLTEMFREYREGKDSYNTIEQHVSVPGSKPSGFYPDGTVVELTEQEDDTVWPEVDFEKLKEINSDLVGWIYIEGTTISYPVVKSDDNEYYLKHLFDKTRNSSGCIFLDMGCAPDLSGPHNILHGHHMKNKSMFAPLVEYKEQKFYDEHPVALFLTPNARYKVYLFSGYVTDNWSSAWYKDFADKDYAAWLYEIKEKSAFVSGVMPKASDKILTLSTCTYEFDDAKFVVHGYMQEVPAQ